MELSYKSIIKEPKIRGLKMIGFVDKYGVNGRNSTERLYGKILRSLRFQDISRKVERKYNIPKNLILAMIMQETGGADLVTNGQNDGGGGLCHMQPVIANKFNLKIYQNCKELVCYKHGEALRQLITRKKFDRKQLIQYDDRLHPILNIDAVGRMLTTYKVRPVAGLKNQWARAIYRYAGRYNFKKYWARVNYYQKKLNNPNVIQAVEKMFNQRNSRLIINGKKGDFDTYIKAHQQQNINYGIQKYR